MPNTKLDARFEAEQHVKAFEAGQKRQAAYEADRAKRLIHQCANSGMSLDQTVALVRRHGIRVQRTAVARWATGAKATKTAVVSTDDGVGKCVSQVVGAATCKAKEHKVRKGIRAETAKTQFAHTVDDHRTYERITAPYRQGGSVSRKVRKRVRGVLRHCDQLAQKGEYRAAIATFNGQ